jgi:hypothetical protein
MTCIHIVLVPSPGGPVPTPQPSPFNGKISMNTSPNVRINARPAGPQAPSPTVQVLGTSTVRIG